MPKSLVIVESPAKAITLKRFLGANYEVEASYGHVRDLPESAREAPAGLPKDVRELGVDVQNDFKPVYVVRAAQRLSKLRAALKNADQLLLATDPDREGESISYHLREVLKPRVPVRRVTFHEITREAVEEAIRDAHEIDENLFRAQESRRIIDRLFGYKLSRV
ncbi:MAG: toprim domain-containing protein, partial [Acidobacteria bacterium]